MVPLVSRCMKYKVGDEVLVKARIVEDSVFGYGLKTYDNIIFNEKKDEVIPVPEMTAEEAWEIAKKILLYPAHGGFNATELEEIFGRTEHLWELTPQEAKAKIEAWEAEKEIKVGDEVDICGDKGIVTSFGTDGDMIHVIYLDGIVNSYRKDKDIKKTGRHIDVDKLLQLLRGEKDA